MAYPEWVLKHKKKGTYINKVGEKYYLYAAHSEHIPGTANKSRRICDGYLGRITEQDGFIPRKPAYPAPVSLEVGLSCAIVSICRKPFDRIKVDYPDSYKYILRQAILSFIYKEKNPKLYSLSYISTLITDNPSIDKDTQFLITRTSSMIDSILTKTFPAKLEYDYFITLMCSIHMIQIKKDITIAFIKDDTTQYIKSLGIDFLEDALWIQLSR